MFKLWSTVSIEAEKELHSDLGIRNWDELSPTDKNSIWHYLKDFFLNDGDHAQRTYWAIYYLNENHKCKSYAQYFLEEPSVRNARTDFEQIFKNQSQHVVLELLSCFCKVLLGESENKDVYRIDGESEEEYRSRLNDRRYEEFDKFSERLNEVFNQFGVNVVLMRQGFIPRQDRKITKEIYEPVLHVLSDEKWGPVSRDLHDAFRDYQLKTYDGYSSCITHTISAIEGFLQIVLYENTGQGTLSDLIQKAQSKNLIPNDVFTQTIFKNTESIFARERKSTSDAHPKDEYATEKNARMILNLAMVFVQHCIQQ